MLLGLTGPEGGLACIEKPGGLELPISITSAPEVIDDVLDHPEEVAIGQGGVRTGSWHVPIGHWRDDRIRLTAGALDPEGVARMRDRLASASAPSEPEAVNGRVSTFCAALLGPPNPALGAAAEAVVGLGLGSTPAGDDVLAGATATLHAVDSAGPAELQGAHRLEILRSVVSRRHRRTTPLSAALLQCAAHGRGIRALRQFIAAASTGNGTGDALQGLLAVGHSSGYFLATGALAAATAVLADEKSRAQCIHHAERFAWEQT